MVLKSLLISIFFVSVSLAQVPSRWAEIDTVTSGNFNDRDPQLDHLGLEVPGILNYVNAQQGEWMIFQRDSAGSSSIVGKQFRPQVLKWDSAESVISPSVPGAVVMSPDICSMTIGPDSLLTVAAWIQDEGAVRRIFYSTTGGDSPTWSSPRELSPDTVRNTVVKLRPAYGSVLATWRVQNVIMCSRFDGSTMSSPDTLVKSNIDSMEYDLNGGMVAYTFRDSQSQKIDLILVDHILGTDSVTYGPDTVRSAGDIHDPAFTPDYPFLTFEVRKPDRQEAHSLSAGGSSANWFDGTLFSSEGVRVTHLAAVSGGDRSTFYIWEEQSATDTSIAFMHGSSDTSHFYSGHDPVMGSLVTFLWAYGYPLNTFSGVAVWETKVNGKSRIMGRPFLPYIGDAIRQQPGAASAFNLFQNYPNPFNPTTTIKFEVRISGFVVMNVYDILGRRVKTLVNSRLAPGVHSVVFDGQGLATGVYFCRLQSDGYTQVRKMILMK